MPSIKLVVFDLDGTLLDSVPDLALAADQAVQALGYPSVTEEQVRDYVGNGADVLIARSLSQSVTVNPDLSSELCDKARVLFDDFYAASGHKLSHLYANVHSTLDTLVANGYTVALLTNKPSKFVPELLEQHQLDKYFTHVLGGDAFPNKKPDPVALNWLMEQEHVSPHEVLMVGDSQNDILAARNAGCLAFGLTYGYNHGEPIANAKPDFVADDVAEVLNAVEKGALITTN
ncbi:phosphoglycolate phosphatase [Vibrio sp. 10N.286.49.C2]|uniref:phosphoglycolate phosphatase n=1 Tax=unclassified Vibrio TaxID=2614977 RepID=UPI000C855641|nr:MULTISPECIES: phosphoglycolate phosphatase [unclassified Vibrio]PMH37897.1 phosphoglycolate phosphatase [Vibrio sp. 10N.286.49.C2]PMH53171.1 phosphoglycolate phosphatase [Vibrio sp. 10N.286.49.B1]PMH84030.1 phosphoglycolate phosphatase [Vibrio sp. 10N.286.48.B7]